MELCSLSAIILHCNSLLLLSIAFLPYNSCLSCSHLSRKQCRCLFCCCCLFILPVRTRKTDVHKFAKQGVLGRTAIREYGARSASGAHQSPARVKNRMYYNSNKFGSPKRTLLPRWGKGGTAQREPKKGNILHQSRSRSPFAHPSHGSGAGMWEPCSIAGIIHFVIIHCIMELMDLFPHIQRQTSSQFHPIFRFLCENFLSRRRNFSVMLTAVFV